jgi:hypothetical protein
MSQGCVASGNVSPSTIVYLDNTQPANQVAQASSATSRPLYGVAQSGTHNTPLTIGGQSLDDGYAAIAGGNIAIFTTGDRCMVVAGGAFNPGDLLTSDSSGRAIATTTAGNFIIGTAIDQALAVNQLVEMRVQPFQHQ